MHYLKEHWIVRSLIILVVAALMSWLVTQSLVSKSDNDKDLQGSYRNVALDVTGTTQQILEAFPTVAQQRGHGQIRTVQWGGDGIPDGWCNKFPGKCGNIRDKASIATIGWQPFGHNPDNVNHGTLPDAWENPVRRHMNNAVKAKGDRGGYDDMVDMADCTKNGYGCWDRVDYQAELAGWEEVTLACAGTVAITTLTGAIPVVGEWLALGPAQSRCFWGTVGYFMGSHAGDKIAR